MNNVLGDHPCEKGNVTIATILRRNTFTYLLFPPLPLGGMKNKYVRIPIQERNISRRTKNFCNSLQHII